MKKFWGILLLLSPIIVGIIIGVLTDYTDTPGELELSNQKKAQEKTSATYEVISGPTKESESRTLALENLDSRDWEMFEPCTEFQKNLKVGDVIKFTYRAKAFDKSDIMSAQPNCHLSTEILNLSEKDKNLRDEAEEMRQKGYQSLKKTQ